MMPEYDVLVDSISIFSDFARRERQDPIYTRARALAITYWSGYAYYKYGKNAPREVAEKLANETIGYFITLAAEVEEGIQRDSW